MARIRTIKPEAFTSESLAQVRVEAERTFYGLLTQADDRGRHRDNAAVIAGVLWPLRPEHTGVHVEEDLRQLAAAGLLCRYTGCDGKRYLHFPTWDRHQKINKPSESRQSVCREHDQKGLCGHCGKTTCQSRATFPEGSGTTTGDFREGSNHPREGSNHASGSGLNGAAPTESVADAEFVGRTDDAEESPGQDVDHLDSWSSPGGLREDSCPGSRIVDLGSRSSDYVGAAEAARADPAPITAQTIVGEWIDRCVKRPPKSVIGRAASQIKKLLDDDQIDPDDIRRGMAQWMAKGADPSAIPSFVNQAMNSGKVIGFPAGQARSTTDERVAQGLALAAELRALEEGHSA